jgi:pyruvate/2-oxoglutarate dehydrogenase complex dihydrolipoamide acyltransferase (E2) component
MEEQAAKGKRVSITHVVGKGIALAVAKAPSMNGYLLWDRYVYHTVVLIVVCCVLVDTHTLQSH